LRRAAAQPGAAYALNKATTMSRNFLSDVKTALVCVVDSTVAELARVSPRQLDVPLLLVRNDGLIYPTRHSYRFAVEPYPRRQHAPPGAH